MPYVKAVFSGNIAHSDEDYANLVLTLGKEHTIYQIGRIVCSPTGNSLDSFPIKKAFAAFKFGNTLVEVEHVDRSGCILNESELYPSYVPGGYASTYQRITRIFDLTTVDGIDEYFEYAANNGVNYSPDDVPAHLSPDIVGNDAYKYIMLRAGATVNAMDLEIDESEMHFSSINKPAASTTKILEWIFELIHYIKSKLEKY